MGNELKQMIIHRVTVVVSPVSGSVIACEPWRHGYFAAREHTRANEKHYVNTWIIVKTCAMQYVSSKVCMDQRI